MKRGKLALTGLTLPIRSDTKHVAILLAAALVACPVHAQQTLRFGAGLSHGTDSESTYGWELEYAQGLNQNAYLSLDWLNEGHQENDHRDGVAMQFWLRANYPKPRLSLAAGIGPYFFFDTARDTAHPYYAPYTNEHGLGLTYSGELAWHWSPHWLVYLRANWIHSHTPHDTSMLLFGFGYQFGSRSPTALSQAPTADTEAAGTLNNEVTVFLGRTILNSFSPEESTALAVEYRHRLNRYSDWTLGWLNEGSNQIIRRNGIIAQFWLVRPLLRERLTLGAGAGAYIVVNQQNNAFVVNNGQVTSVGGDDERVGGIITLTASYRLSPRWSARLSFNRLVTGEDRDADVILLGAGFRF